MDIDLRGTAHKIEHYGDTHYNKAISIGRMILGAFIFYKGVFFIQDTSYLANMMASETSFNFMNFMIAHYVASVHLVGGILIAIGLVTRAAIVFQIPVLIGAVIFNVMRQGFYSYHGQDVNVELILSIVTLAALVFYLIYGSGPWSADYYVFHHKERKGHGLID